MRDLYFMYLSLNKSSKLLAVQQRGSEGCKEAKEEVFGVFQQAVLER